VGDYLEALFSLQAEGEAAFAVSLAELFAVSRANASATLGRLARDGLVVQDGRRVLLTDTGRARAEASVRRHRTVECFLLTVLDMPWAEVHSEARSFARGMTAFIEERIDSHLEWPRFCPHGDPIPRPDLDAASFLGDQGAIRLSRATAGLPLRILAISELAPDATHHFQFCAEHGLLPGTPLTITTPAQAQADLLVSVSRTLVPIAPALAGRIWTLPLEGASMP
jgi:DtxR family Mn-dependent transcriptional regulator